MKHPDRVRPMNEGWACWHDDDWSFSYHWNKQDAIEAAEALEAGVTTEEPTSDPDEW